MDRNLLFFTMGLVCFYLILDEVMGKKRISAILGAIGQGGGNSYAPPIPDEWEEMSPEQKEDIQEGRLTSNDDPLLDEWKGKGVYV